MQVTKAARRAAMKNRKQKVKSMTVKAYMRWTKERKKAGKGNRI